MCHSYVNFQYKKHNKTKMDRRLCFKYMSLRNPERLLEIVYRHQLYAPTINELNDIKEGYVRFSSTISNDDKKTLLRRLYNETYVVSTTCETKSFNGHMFAIYGDCHKGCCLKLYVTSLLKTNIRCDVPWIEKKVDYDSKIKEISKIDDDTIADILKIKSKQWKDESEIRYIKTIDKGKRPYLKIKLLGIYFGVKVSKRDFNMYNAFIKAFDKNIDVKHLTNKDIDFGFEDE